MILCLRTDSPDAELYLMDNDARVDTYTWHADRTLAKYLLKEINALLERNNQKWSGITAIVVFRGPGSFTGLRIGCTVMNTLAYAHNTPIVGAMGDDWIEQGCKRIQQGNNDGAVMPEYGAAPRITTPRK